jgi:hypothetical protein
MSYYSVNTKRRFFEVMVNPFYRSSYRLGQRVEKIIKKRIGWVLFDLSISQPSTDPEKDPPPNATIDSLAITEFGAIAMFFQDYTGKIASQTEDDNWVVFESSKEDSPGDILPSPVTAVENVTALVRELFASEDMVIRQVIPIMVFRDKCDISDIQLDGDIRKVHYRQLTKELQEMQRENGALYNKEEWLAATRALVPYANSVIAKPQFSRKGSKDVITIAHDFVSRKNLPSTNFEFMRKASMIAAAKEEFDALTWRRILEISQELEGDCSKERKATLLAELQQVAHTNIALQYNFGATETPFNTQPSPEEIEFHSQALDSMSRGIRETTQTDLDSSDFFDQGFADICEPGDEQSVYSIHPQDDEV